jgi:hypothetical protein
MRVVIRCLTAAALIATARIDARAQNANVQLTMKDGLVTLVVRNVPVREVLKEWARVGQTQIVNAEKLAGTPVTLQIVDQPEGRVLDILLRSAAGYIAAPRAAARNGASIYDRIAILASSQPPAGAPPPVMAAAPVPMSVHQVPTDAVDDDPINVTSAAGAQPLPTTLAPPPSILPGLNPQLEGSQPRGLDLRTLMQNANGPTTAPRPGPLPQATPGTYRNPNQLPRPGGGGGN